MNRGADDPRRLASAAGPPQGAGMGAKYMPTDRDVKAAKRYQEKMERLAREKKLAAVRSAKPAAGS